MTGSRSSAARCKIPCGLNGSKATFWICINGVSLIPTKVLNNQHFSLNHRNKNQRYYIDKQIKHGRSERTNKMCLEITCGKEYDLSLKGSNSRS